MRSRNRLDSRLARLEGSSAEPMIEDWLAVLDAQDQPAAIAAMEARFPIILSPQYRCALDLFG